MAMEPSSKQDGVVNITRAMEALSPWLYHSRRTIIKVEALVVAAAVLLLLQLVLGSCKRRWHCSFLKYGLQACNGIMFPLIVYTLGTMQSSPIKNSSYPVLAGFLIMASGGTTAVQQYDFYENTYRKYIECAVDTIKYTFYLTMFVVLIDPNTNTLETSFDLKHIKNATTSSYCVTALFWVILMTKFFESGYSVFHGYKKKGIVLSLLSLSISEMKSRRTQVAETVEESANDHACDSDPQSMKGYRYVIYQRRDRLITIDEIWDCCGNSANGKALKDLCLSYALFRRLLNQRYFGYFYFDTSSVKAHNFVFKKLLPSEGDFKRAFRIIEVELGFCYDFFFTKYNVVSAPMPLLPSMIVLKITLILIVGVLAIRNLLVLETPNPIIEVHISEADYIILLLVLSVALIVELVQAVIYLASNWAQRVMISGKLRSKINQCSLISGWKQPVEVSDAVKRAVAGSLIATYGTYITTTNGETTVRRHNRMSNEYSWALKDLSQLELMLIWHIATEYCDISDDPSGNGTAQSTSEGANLFGYVLQLLRPYPRRNRIARDGHRGVAVHLSRYCVYLIGFVPELLPYHESDVEELAAEVMEERKEVFGSNYILPEVYHKMKVLEGTEGEDDPRKIFQKGVKLGKQLERMPDGDCWEVLQDFWAETIIHAAASHYTTKQHMQHLENGGEFLTHIWALLSHAGILNLNRRMDQQDQGNPGSGPSSAV